MSAITVSVYLYQRIIQTMDHIIYVEMDSWNRNMRGSTSPVSEVNLFLGYVNVFLAEPPPPLLIQTLKSTTSFSTNDIKP